jgi:hypothetical protein
LTALQAAEKLVSLKGTAFRLYILLWNEFGFRPLGYVFKEL